MLYYMVLYCIVLQEHMGGVHTVSHRNVATVHPPRACKMYLHCHS